VRQKLFIKMKRKRRSCQIESFIQQAKQKTRKLYLKMYKFYDRKELEDFSTIPIRPSNILQPLYLEFLRISFIKNVIPHIFSHDSKALSFQFAIASRIYFTPMATAIARPRLKKWLKELVNENNFDLCVSSMGNKTLLEDVLKNCSFLRKENLINFFYHVCPWKLAYACELFSDVDHKESRQYMLNKLDKMFGDLPESIVKIIFLYLLK
jgi:hypothetical protein